MNWFLVIFLTQMQGHLHEGFLWYNPKFDNKEQCIEWANNNPGPIIQTLNYYYEDWTIDNVYCIREDRLKDLKMIPYVKGEGT